MAEHTVNTVPETLRLKFLDLEHRVESSIDTYYDQSYTLALVAWAILSAAYSADNEASIDILGHGQRRDPIHIQFYVDDKFTVENVYSRIREDLAAENSNESSFTIGTDSVKPLKVNVPNGAKASEGAISGLPKVLITPKFNAAAYEIIEEATYDLAITLVSGEGGQNQFRLGACSKSSLDESEVDLILDRCKYLINQFQGEMHKGIQELDLLTTWDEKNLSALNERMPPAEYAFVHELVAQQARLRPNYEAVCAWDGSLTYEELDQKAVGVAKHLVQRGVTVRSWVPLLFKKSKWHIVSMLAVGLSRLSGKKRKADKRLLGDENWCRFRVAGRHYASWSHCECPEAT